MNLQVHTNREKSLSIPLPKDSGIKVMTHCVFYNYHKARFIQRKWLCCCVSPSSQVKERYRPVVYVFVPNILSIIFFP